MYMTEYMAQDTISVGMVAVLAFQMSGASQAHAALG
jgi:hypothetical protein